MTRPMIMDNRKKTVASVTDTRSTEKTGLTGQVQVLNRKRSARYLSIMTGLDAGGHTTTEPALEAILNAIRAELPELSVDEIPAGIISRCYLGDPYEVHILSLTGSIIHHYEVREPLPDGFEPARSLALHPQYLFIEIYRDGSMRAVEKDGTVILIGGKKNVK